MDYFDELKNRNSQVREIQKANIYNSFEKGGEGSIGGKIIDHTKSGKPVYAKKSNNEIYSSFSKQDHLEASKIHDEHANKNRSYNKFNEHLGYSAGHKKMAENNYNQTINNQCQTNIRI